MILKPISNLAINAADIVEFMQWKLIMNPLISKTDLISMRWDAG